MRIRSEAREFVRLHETSYAGIVPMGHCGVPKDEGPRGCVSGAFSSSSVATQPDTLASELLLL